MLIKYQADVGSISSTGEPQPSVKLNYRSVRTQLEVFRLCLNIVSSMALLWHCDARTGKFMWQPQAWLCDGAVCAAGMTPLMLSVEAKQHKNCEVLLESGAGAQHATMTNM